MISSSYLSKFPKGLTCYTWLVHGSTVFSNFTVPGSDEWSNFGNLLKKTCHSDPGV